MADTETPIVHLVAKTHLDVGFTAPAANVVATYVEGYIPAALALGAELRARGGPERFVWTTGSWLVHTFLERADAAGRAAAEAAIEAGDLAWHALPFTTHTELCDPALVEAGLEIAARLDHRFGRRTVVAKLTDVPGHTRGLVPLLAGAGVELLHVGVNPVATVPEVPGCFRWRSPDGAEVTVVYQAGGYGDLTEVPGCPDRLAFAHTGDNLGPPSADDVLASFAALRERVPGAEVRGSTLDAFAVALRPAVADLPVVTEEIGDTWIHGVGSDPGKVAAYRELLRLRRSWAAAGMVAPDDSRLRGFHEGLLLVAEHTWGLDEKTHLPDRERWGPDDLPVLRAEPRTRAFEASWDEQRAYVGAAVEAIDSEGLRRSARSTLSALRSPVPAYAPGPELDSARVGVEGPSPDDVGRSGLPGWVGAAERAGVEGSLPDDVGRSGLPGWVGAAERVGVGGLPPDEVGRPGLPGRMGAAERAGPGVAPSGLGLSEAVVLGPWEVAVDRTTGAVAHLRDRVTGRVLADADHPLGLLVHQAFSGADYDRYLAAYVHARPEDEWWALEDNTKPGIDAAGAISAWWEPEATEVREGLPWGRTVGLGGRSPSPGAPGGLDRIEGGAPAMGEMWSNGSPSDPSASIGGGGGADPAPASSAVQPEGRSSGASAGSGIIRPLGGAGGSAGSLGHGPPPDLRSVEALVVTVRFPAAAHTRSGAPAEAALTLTDASPDEGPSTLGVELRWSDKPANRLPEATWLGWRPAGVDPEAMVLDKLGQEVSPLDVVAGGGRHLHAVGEGVRWPGAEGTVALRTLDAPLVAPGRPRLLDPDPGPLDLAHGAWVCLLDNVWGTNFPMWSEGAARFRFELSWEPAERKVITAEQVRSLRRADRR